MKPLSVLLHQLLGWVLYRAGRYLPQPPSLTEHNSSRTIPDDNNWPGQFKPQLSYNIPVVIFTLSSMCAAVWLLMCNGSRAILEG